MACKVSKQMIVQSTGSSFKNDTCHALTQGTPFAAQEDDRRISCHFDPVRVCISPGNFPATPYGSSILTLVPCMSSMPPGLTLTTHNCHGAPLQRFRCRATNMGLLPLWPSRRMGIEMASGSNELMLQFQRANPLASRSVCSLWILI